MQVLLLSSLSSHVTQIPQFLFSRDRERTKRREIRGKSPAKYLLLLPSKCWAKTEEMRKTFHFGPKNQSQNSLKVLAATKPLRFSEAVMDESF